MVQNQILEYRTSAVPWAPPETMEDREGSPLDPESDFFQQPPADIGQVISAYTSLKRHRDAVALPVRMATIALAAVPGLAMVYFSWAHVRKEMEFSFVAIGLLIAIAGVSIAIRQMRFVQTCSYAGTRGAVRYYLRGSRMGRRREEGVRFVQAAELRVGVMVTSRRSIHEDTLYRYDWTDPAGNFVYRLNGHYRPSKKSVRAAHPYTFGKAVDIAWTNYLSESASIQFAAQGFLHFALRSGQWVRIRPDYLEIADGDESARIMLADIQSFTLTKGVFRIVTPDPKQPGEVLRFAFDYPKLANAGLFRRSLREVMGVQV